MFNFKYEIKTNDVGRPYVNILDQVDHPEHKFMAIEVTRYLLNGLLKDDEKERQLSEDDFIAIARASNLLEEISDRIAMMLSEQNNALGELGLQVQDDE